MKKILMLVLLALATLLSAQTATVTGLDPNGDGFLSLRAKPKGREIGKLYNGNKVKILKKKGKYYKVKVVKSGMVGYAHGNWIRKSHTSNSSNTSTSHKQGTVHGLDPNGDGFLSLRNKPKGREIGKLYNGDRVDILATHGKWYKVKLANSDQVGWAHGNWVRVKGANYTKKSTTHRKPKKAMNADQVAAGLLFSGLKWLYGGGSHSSSSSSSTRTSGSKNFSCHYYCRTDGLLDNHTSTFNVNIYANSRYQAEDKLGDIAKKHCQNMKASGKWMWATSKRCD